LRRNELIAPTPEELERRYIDHDAFVERGLEWDRDQVNMLEAWNKRQKMLDAKDESRTQKLESFTGQKKEVSAIVPVTQDDVI